MRFLCAVAFLIGCALPTEALAQTPLINCPFDDTLPVTCSFDLPDVTPSTGSFDMAERSGIDAPGACAADVGWNRTRSATGGYNNGPYMEYTYCDRDLHTDSHFTDPQASFQTGFTFDVPTAQHGWTKPTVWFMRFRWFPVNAITATSSSVEQKLFIWHAGGEPADRVVMFIRPGDNGGVCNNATTLVCLLLLRNIFTGLDECRMAIPVGEWSHIQLSWRHGAVNTSFLRGWLNNNVEASPTCEDLTLDASGTWNRTDALYDAPADWMNFAGSDSITADWSLRNMNLIVDDAFDAAWSPTGGGGAGSRGQGIRNRLPVR